MANENLRGLRGYRHLSDLTDSERAVWEKQNADKLKGKSWEKTERLWLNQQFVKKFGMDMFKSYDWETRDKIAEDAAYREEFYDRFNPYEDKKDKNGNPIKVVNPNKGTGNEELFYKYLDMDTEGIKELIESGYLNREELKENSPKENALGKLSNFMMEASNNANIPGGTNAVGSIALKLGALVPEFFRQNAHSYNEKENQAKADEVYNRYAMRAQKEAEDSDDFLEAYSNTINEGEEATEKAFNNLIHGDIEKGVRGSTLAAYIDNNTGEVEDFTFDDKRKFIATYDALAKKYGHNKAMDILDNWTNNYAIDNRSLLKEGLIHGKSFAIGMTNNLANSVEGLVQLEKQYNNKDVEVWVSPVNITGDPNGHIVDPAKVTIDSNGNAYTTVGDTKVPVKKGKIDTFSLYQMGKNEDGSDRTDILNPIYWEKASRYNVWSDEEIEQADKIGMSPTQILYSPGETSYAWETAMMMTFSAADIAAMAATNGLIGGTGKLIQGIGKTGSLINKTASVIGKTVEVTGKLASKAYPLVSARGIGTAYGTGVLSENQVRNLQELEKTVTEHYQHEFSDKYSKDSEFKNTIDAEVNDEYNKLLKQLDSNAMPAVKDSNTKKVVGGINQEVLGQARHNVAKRHVQQDVEDYKQGLKTPKGAESYTDALMEAYKDASNGAEVAAATVAVKYGLINTLGWRKIFYGKAYTPGSPITSAFSKMPLKEKFYYVGKNTLKAANDGGWTNYTDELQSSGGKYISNDSFDNYLAGMYDPEAERQVYSAGDGLLSYLKGAEAVIGKESSIKAYLIGAAGGFNPTPNIAKLVRFAIPGKNYRDAAIAEWQKNAKDGNPANNIATILINPVLSQYVADKGAMQQDQARNKYIKAYINRVDEEARELRSAMAANLAAEDMTNDNIGDTNASVVKFIRALGAARSLSTLGKQLQADKKGIPSTAIQRVIQEVKNLFYNEADVATLQQKADEIAAIENSSLYQQAMETLNDVTSGKITEDKAKELLDNYYATNPSVARTAENDVKAIETIQQNAKDMKGALDIYNRAEESINNVEKSRGSKLDASLKARLITRQAVSIFIDKELDRLSQKTGLSSEYSSRNTPGDGHREVFGTKKSLQHEIDFVNEQIEKFSEEKATTRTEENKKLSKEIEDIVEKAKAENRELTGDEKTQIAEKIDKINRNEYKNNVETSAKQMYEQRKSALEQFAEEAKEQGESILSADEILALNPVDRARMLNPKNAGNYSTKQRSEINKAKNKLTKENSDALNDVEAMGYLALRRNANLDAIESIINNPEEAAVAYEMQVSTAIEEMARNQKNLYFDRIKHKLKKASNGIDKYDPIVSVDSVLRQLNKETLDALYEMATSKTPDKELAKHIDAIKRAQELAPIMEKVWTLYKEAEDAANTKDSAKKAEFEAFRSEIGSILLLSRTNEQFEDALKIMLKSKHSDKLTKLAESLGLAIETEKAVKTETKKEKEEREEKAAKEKEKEKKKEEASKKSEEKAADDTEIKEVELKETLFSKEEEEVKEEPGTDTIKDSEEKGISKPDKHNPNYLVKSPTSFTITIDGRENSVEVTPIEKEQDGNKVITFKSKTTYKKDYRNHKRGDVVEASEGKGYIVIDDSLIDFDKTYGTDKDGTKELDRDITNMFGDKTPVKLSSITINPTTGEIKGTLIKGNSKTREVTLKENPLETKRKEAPKVEEREGKTSKDAATESRKDTKTESKVPEESPTTEDKATESSPTEKEQVKEVKDNPKVDMQVIQTDTSDEGNAEITTSRGQGLIGNRLYNYDVDVLVVQGILQKREFDKDVKDVDTWFDENGINVQEIIDTELNSILKANPKIQLMYVNNSGVQGHDKNMARVVLTCVEYTDDVAKVHNEKLGKPVEFNGKKYLIIGTFGFNSNIDKDGTAYYNTIDKVMKNAYSYFTTEGNQKKRFYVENSIETEASQILSGRLVKRLPKDSEAGYRSVEELLSDPERNPYGYTLEDVKWAIQYDANLHTVNVSGKNKVYPPRDTLSNSGAVFLLVPTSSGTFIPAYIKPVMLSEINKESDLFKEINNLLHDLGEEKYELRRNAIDKLVKLLVLDGTGTQILVGTEKVPTVTLLVGGRSLVTYNVNSTDFNVNRMIDTIIEELNPRINVTLSSLTNVESIKRLSDAGALSTNIAYLGTKNAGYLLYDIGSDGKPVKPKTPITPEPIDGPRIDDSIRERKENVIVDSTEERYIQTKDGFLDSSGNLITDKNKVAELGALSYINECKKNGISANWCARDASGRQCIEYYVGRSAEGNTIITKYNNITKKIEFLEGEEAQKIMNIINNYALETERKRKAKEEADKLRTSEKVESKEKVEPEKKQSKETIKGKEKSPEEYTNEEMSKMVEDLMDLDLTDGEEKKKNDEEIVTEGIDSKGSGVTILGMESLELGSTDAKKESTEKVEPHIESKTPSNTEEKKESLEEKKKKAADNLNKGGTKSLAEMRSTSNSITTVEQAFRDRTLRASITSILKEKGIERMNLPKLIEWCKENNIPIENIDNIDAWIDLIKNCR